MCPPHRPPQPWWARVPSLPAGGGRRGCPCQGAGCPPSRGGGGAMGDPLPCCAGDPLGGSRPPPLSHTPSNLRPPSPKRFSGPFPLRVPPSGEGGSAAAAFHCLWGGTGPPHLGSACWGGWRPSAPICRGAQKGLTPYHPQKMGGVLLALVYGPLTLPLVQLITLGGGTSLPLPRAFCCPPPRGCVLGGSPASGLSPWPQMPPMCLGTPRLRVPPSPARAVPGGGS